jgi:hypothetical protein
MRFRPSLVQGPIDLFGDMSLGDWKEKISPIRRWNKAEGNGKYGWIGARFESQGERAIRF